MTKENQLRLYKHFQDKVSNPATEGLHGQDLNFIVKQAKEQIVAILKVYPEFADSEEKEKPKKSK